MSRTLFATCFPWDVRHLGLEARSADPLARGWPGLPVAGAHRSKFQVSGKCSG